MKVFINSKGRGPVPPTVSTLRSAGVPYALIVEPQDVPRYDDAAVRVLPANDRGLPYARNFALAQGREGGGWFWVLDDDITGFYRVEGARCVPTDAGAVLMAAEALFAARGDVALSALEYRQFAWSATKALAFDSYCDVAVCIHAERTRHLKFREELVFKGDRDFTLQVLASGFHTVRARQLAFSAVKNGSNEGGLHDKYHTPGAEAAASRRMCELWGPAICQPHTKPDGRPDVKINWRYFANASRT